MTKQSKSKCECSDPGCAEHQGKSACGNTKRQTLYRVDMEDRTGTYFCLGCGEDAAESGLFGSEPNFYSR